MYYECLGSLIRKIVYPILSALFLIACSTNNLENNNANFPKDTLSPNDSSELIYTSVVIDGDPNDWDKYPILSSDVIGDQKNQGTDFVELKSFKNDRFLYILLGIDSYGPIKNFKIELLLEDDVKAWIIIPNDSPTIKTRYPISSPDVEIDAETSWGKNALEIKVPLEFFEEDILQIEIVRAMINDSDSSDTLSGGDVFVSNEIEKVELVQNTPSIGKGDQNDNQAEGYENFNQDLVNQIINSHVGETLLTQEWVRLGGPPGGLGYDIRVNYENTNTWYVTDAYSGIYRSLDRGVTWTSVNAGIGDESSIIAVFSTTVDPNNPEIVWAGLLGAGRVFRTQDGGNTWELRNNGVDETNFTIRSITIEPGNSDVVYIGGEISPIFENGQELHAFGYGKTKGIIYKSTNAGESWERVWLGDNLVRYIIVHPENPDILYASTGIFDRSAYNADEANNITGGVGVIKSVDGGQTWTQINNGLENLYIGSLIMHPDDPEVLVAAAGHNRIHNGSGVYVTRDGGESWKKIIADDNWWFMSVEIHLTQTNFWYAAGSGTGFYASQDGGESWEHYTKQSSGAWGPEGYRDALPIDLQVDPEDPLRIFSNNYGGGNFVSEDGGKTWKSASIGYSGNDTLALAVHPNNPAIIYAAGRSALHVSEDGGFSWRGIKGEGTPMQVSTAIGINPGQNSEVLIGDMQSGWIFYSKDGGSSWITAADEWQYLNNEPHGNAGVYSFAYLPSNPDVIYAGYGKNICVGSRSAYDCSETTSITLSKSEDGGNSWEILNPKGLQGLQVARLLIDHRDEKRFWAATGQGLFKSEDATETWTFASDNLPIVPTMDFVQSPFDFNILILGTTGQGIYRSIDGGSTWENSSLGLDPNEHITALVADPVREGVIYAGTELSGVYVSENSGQSWQKMNQGLEFLRIVSLSISNDGTTLYAGTNGRGTFRLSLLSQDEFNQIKDSE